MRRLLILLLLIAIASSLAGYLPPINVERALDVYDSVLSFIGKSQLTNKFSLIGKRSYCGSDRYTGDYFAECNNKSGRDIIFGGTSIKERCMNLSAHILRENGSAILRIRMGEAINEYYPDENGDIDITLDFEGGSNYIMIDYDNFRGTVTLSSKYYGSPA